MSIASPLKHVIRLRLKSSRRKRQNGQPQSKTWRNWAAPHEPIASAAPLPPVDVAKTEPVLNVRLDEFMPGARQKAVETNKKYLGKVIQLKGNVFFTYRTVSKGGVVSTMLQLITTSHDSINCEMSDPEAWKRVGSGTEVTLKGKLAAYVLPPGAVGNPAERIGNLVECGKRFVELALVGEAMNLIVGRRSGSGLCESG